MDGAREARGVAGRGRFGGGPSPRWSEARRPRGERAGSRPGLHLHLPARPVLLLPSARSAMRAGKLPVRLPAHDPTLSGDTDLADRWGACAAEKPNALAALPLTAGYAAYAAAPAGFTAAADGTPRPGARPSRRG